MKRFIRIWTMILIVALVSVGHGAVVFSASLPEENPAEGAQATEKPEEEKTEEEKAKEAYEKEMEAVYKMPVQSNEIKGWAEGPGTYGEADIVMDAGSGAILYAKNIDSKEFPASITKALTALLAFKYGNMQDNVPITPESLSCLGAGYASIGLKEGNVISMEQAMYAMLLASSNEVACAVGETIARSNGQEYGWFIQLMNETVKELGGTNSNFVNTNGVHDEQHYTCARDMALIGSALFDYPEFFTISKTQQYTIPASETSEEHIFQQKHEMLLENDKNHYQYAVGGKTGYTTEANNTLITLADNGEMQLVCVALKTYAGHVYTDTMALLDYGFENFKKVSIKENEDSKDIEEIPEDAYVVLPKDVKFENLDREISLHDNQTNQATVTYSYKDIPVGSAEVTMSSFYKNSDVTFTEAKSEPEEQTVQEPEKAKLSKNQMLVVAAIAVAAFGILIIAVRSIIIKSRRKRRRRYGPRPR